MTIKATGERLIVEEYQSSAEDYVIYLMHMATYKFAERYIKQARILDYGCGSGYGAAALAQHATSVTAVDVAADAIDHAQESHKRENLRYLRVDPDSSLPFENDSFDVVVSIQVIEHVRDADVYLGEIHRVLKQGGLLLLVTPDRATRLLPGQKPWNRWHLHEYGARELTELVKKHFGSVQLETMSGRREMIEIELRRCARLKWLTLPITLPIMPERLRVMGLNLLHRIRGNCKAGGTKLPPFTVEDVYIGTGLTPSLNLLVRATKQ